MTRWLPFVVAALLAGAAITGLILGMRARSANAPTRFGTYSIVTRVEGEAEYFDVMRDGKIAHTLGGSLDTLCDPPTVAALDVDGDGDTDLYFRNCRGHGFLSRHGDALTFTNLEGGQPDGWWAHQVLSGGGPLLAASIATFIAALIALSIAGARLRPSA